MASFVVKMGEAQEESRMKFRYWLVTSAVAALSACGGKSDIQTACAKFELDPDARPYVTKGGNDFETFCACVETVLGEASAEDQANGRLTLKVVTDRMSEDQPRVDPIADEIEEAAEADSASEEALALEAGMNVIDDVISEAVDRLEANDGKCLAAG